MILSLPKCALSTKEFNLLFLICVALLSTCNFVYSHVSLSFPKARKYDFDFLDNGRTKGPCGMPKGIERTSLPAGVQFNVTWHLAYPHKGGFRLELLDPSEKLILNLTQSSTSNPANNWIKDDDVTTQSYPVTLPKTLVCRGCTIRLLRQASEWGDKYTFWSCADVDIIPVSSIVTSKNAVCSGNGKFDKDLGACRCNRPYSGIVCQFLVNLFFNFVCSTFN
uniref:Chitin-binding type-4 domain-containing protein n=1 Tax=Tetranychus urticae TaxID=32264 RepID=T1K348_TETUR